MILKGVDEMLDIKLDDYEVLLNKIYNSIDDGGIIKEIKKISYKKEKNLNKDNIEKCFHKIHCEMIVENSKYLLDIMEPEFLNNSLLLDVIIPEWVCSYENLKTIDLHNYKLVKCNHSNGFACFIFPLDFELPETSTTQLIFFNS